MINADKPPFFCMADSSHAGVTRQNLKVLETARDQFGKINSPTTNVICNIESRSFCWLNFILFYGFDLNLVCWLNFLFMVRLIFSIPFNGLFFTVITRSKVQ